MIDAFANETAIGYTLLMVLVLFLMLGSNHMYRLTLQKKAQTPHRAAEKLPDGKFYYIVPENEYNELDRRRLQDAQWQMQKRYDSDHPEETNIQVVIRSDTRQAGATRLSHVVAQCLADVGYKRVDLLTRAPVNLSGGLAPYGSSDKINITVVLDDEMLLGGSGEPERYLLRMTPAATGSRDKPASARPQLTFEQLEDGEEFVTSVNPGFRYVKVSKSEAMLISVPRTTVLGRTEDWSLEMDYPVCPVPRQQLREVSSG